MYSEISCTQLFVQQIDIPQSCYLLQLECQMGNFPISLVFYMWLFTYFIWQLCEQICKKLIFLEYLCGSGKLLNWYWFVFRQWLRVRLVGRRQKNNYSSVQFVDGRAAVSCRLDYTSSQRRRDFFVIRPSNLDGRRKRKSLFVRSDGREAIFGDGQTARLFCYSFVL